MERGGIGNKDAGEIGNETDVISSWFYVYRRQC